MRPTVPELLTGIADALAADVAPHLTDVAARHQVGAAVAMLRRLATLVPQLTPHLWAGAADLASTLRAIAPEHPDVRAAGAAFDALDPTRASLDELQAVHQQLLGVLDAVVAAPPPSPEAAGALAALLERGVVRERDLGASIAGR